VRTGRDFDRHDISGAPRVAIVNEAFVTRKDLNGQDVLGRRILMSGGAIEIVGVVNSVKDRNPGDDSGPIVYRLFEQALPDIGWSHANLILRTNSEPLSVSESVRQVIASILPNVAIHDVRRMDQRLAALVAPQRQRAVVFSLFGATAVLLAAAGIYGLLAYVVSQQSREFGIRLALGAGRIQLASLVLWRAVSAASIGLGIGVLAAQLLTWQLTGMLNGVSPSDPTTHGVALLVMLVVVAIASFLPVRRAVSTDPLAVLRKH